MLEKSFAETAKEMVERAIALTNRAREVDLELVDLLGMIHDWKFYACFVHDQNTFAEKILGMSAKEYWIRVNAYRAFRNAPELREMVLRKETYLSHVALTWNKITPANRQVLVEGIRGKTKREVEDFLKRLSPRGEIRDPNPEVQITITITREDLAKLERLQDALSSSGWRPNHAQALMHAVEHCLAKRDQMGRARRWGQRMAKKEAKAPHQGTETISPGTTAQGKESATPVSPGTAAHEKTSSPSVSPGTKRSRYIPAHIRHAVLLRDGGRCSYVYPNGDRCEARATLQFDHVKPWSCGGEHSVENLRVLCRDHNMLVAIQALGADVMRPYLRC